MEGLKNCLAQNKEIYKSICEMKNEQREFYDETNKKIDEVSEKVDQLMVPEDSYWKVFLYYHFCITHI